MIGAIADHRAYTGPAEELAAHWHDDMIWWGPEGVGATWSIARYIEQHQQPFRNQLADRAEGKFGGFFGWPNLSLTPTGGFMGLPAGPRADMRVVDIYRREASEGVARLSSAQLAMLCDPREPQPERKGNWEAGGPRSAGDRSAGVLS